MIVKCYWCDSEGHYFRDYTYNCTAENCDLIKKWFHQEINAGRILDYRIEIDESYMVKGKES